MRVAFVGFRNDSDRGLYLFLAAKKKSYPIELTVGHVLYVQHM